MTTTATPLIIRDALQTLAARDGARSRVATSIISVTRMLDAPDPVGAFRHGRGQDRMFWERAVDRLTFVAVGNAAQCTGTGKNRWQQVGDGWRHLTAHTVVDSDERYPWPTPVCLGGFAFDAGRRHDSDWAPYPDGLLVVPRVLLTQNESAAWVTVNVPVSGDVDVAAEIAESVSTLSVMIEPDEAAPTTSHGPGLEVDRVPDGDGAEDWKNAVSAILEDIRRGIVEKQVLARCVRTATRAEAADIVDRLRTAFGTSCTIFAVARGDACFLGASPERLVRVDGHAVRTDALAGSAKRASDGDEDLALGNALRRDPKERHEHALVVRALQTGLAPYCLAVTAPEEPSLMRMPNVQHLHTPVEGVLRGDSHILELAECLHPTPAVGGVPQGTVLQRIRSYEGFDRGWYAGPVGWMDAGGGGDFAIAIRSALMTDASSDPGTHQVVLYAGCGIVAGSDPDAEYQESRLKLRPLAWGTQVIEPPGATASDGGASPDVSHSHPECVDPVT
jgi:isochorismate synthase